MKKYILFFIFLFTSTLFSFGNDYYYQKGYIVSLDNDTIPGMIERLSEAKMKDGITFKRENATEAETYAPLKIAAFGFDDEINFSSIEYNYQDVDKVKRSIRCFAKRLLIGDFNLYKLQLSSLEDDYVYIIQKDSQYYSIRQAIGATERPNGKINQKDIGILIYLLQPCPEEVESIKNTKFQDIDFINLFSKYSVCAAPDVETAVFKHKVKGQVTYMPDLGYSGLFLKDASLQGFSASIHLDFYNSSLSENFSLLTGLRFICYNVSDFNPDMYYVDSDFIYAVELPVLANINLYRNLSGQSFNFQLGLNFSYIDHSGFMNVEAGLSYQIKRIRFSVNGEYDYMSSTHYTVFAARVGYCF